MQRAAHLPRLTDELAVRLESEPHRMPDVDAAAQAQLAHALARWSRVHDRAIGLAGILIAASVLALSLL